MNAPPHLAQEMYIIIAILDEISPFSCEITGKVIRGLSEEKALSMRTTQASDGSTSFHHTFIITLPDFFETVSAADTSCSRLLYNSLNTFYLNPYRDDISCSKFWLLPSFYPENPCTALLQNETRDTIF